MEFRAVKLHQMKAFRELMLTGSVSEAARNLHRTQPSISSSVAALEDELEMKLFERRNGRLHPVPEAQYLLGECSDLLERLEMLKRNMRGLKSLATGHLDIVCMPGPSVFMMPDMISRFCESRPQVSCELMTRSSDVVYQQIAAQQYDIGFADYLPDAVRDNALLDHSVFTFECLCAVHKGSPLAREESLSPEILAGHPLASLFPGHEIHRNVTQAFSLRGLTPDVRFTARYFIPLMTFVERGQACSIIDPLAAESYRLYRGGAGDVVFLPFRPKVTYRVALLTPVHRTRSLVASGFYDHMRDEIIRIGGQVR